jgi:multisubunit Na+/H+ antiporter MnhC subunit
MTPAVRLAILAGLAVGFLLVWGLAALIGGGWQNLRRNLPLMGLGFGVLAAVVVGGTWLMSWIHPLLLSGVYLALAVIGWLWVGRRERRQPTEVREAQRQAWQQRQPLAIVLTAVVIAYVLIAVYLAISVLQR